MAGHDRKGRHGRVERLVEVGPAGQARIGEANVAVDLVGLAARVAARYLSGAGVAHVRVRNEALAAEVTAVDARVGVDVGPVPDGPPADADAPALGEFRDAAARDVARGAMLALRSLRAALSAGQGTS